MASYRFDGYNWLVRLNKGEELVSELNKIVTKEKIGGAWVNGLGAALSAQLGCYDLKDKKYVWQNFEQPMEILSLQGNVSWKDEKPVLHIHGTFSGEDLQAFGGHVKELVVAGTCEVLLHRWYEQSGLSRGYDDETGLNLLDV